MRAFIIVVIAMMIVGCTVVLGSGHINHHKTQEVLTKKDLACPQ